MPKLYPYQKEYAHRKAKLDITNKSRQIGFSSGAVAYKAVRRCYFEGIDQMLVSSSQRQADKLMSYVERWIERVYSKLWRVKLVKDTVTQKTFSNGKSIYSLPSKPETIRGFPGDVRIDEFALHKEDKKMYESLLPSVVKQKKYQISIVSTPLGQSNMFYEIFSDINKYPDYIRKKINCYDAIKQGCEMDIEHLKRNFDEESFRQEFLCEFIDEASAYFTYELLKNCTEDFSEDALKGKCFIGIDIGRTHDLTAIAVIIQQNERYYLKQLEVLKNRGFKTQFDVICTILKEEQPVSVYADKGAIGMQLAEELEKRFGYVTGVQMTPNVKNDCVTFCRMLMEKRNFVFNEDKNGRALITEFHSIKRNVNISNNISFDSARDKTGHADRAWAVMLALLASKNQNEIKISSL